MAKKIKGVFLEFGPNMWRFFPLLPDGIPCFGEHLMRENEIVLSAQNVALLN